VKIGATRARYSLLRRRIAGDTVAGTFALFCLANSLLMVNFQVSRLFLLDEAGYGDSYILYDALHFQDTGVIYRDLSQPPYLPTQYSPLVYMLYSLPGRIGTFPNPFIGPRLIAIAAFLLCVAVVISIVRTLVPARHAWLWGLLLGTSIISMQDWVLQLRGDFSGIFFSLLAIRLLLARHHHASLFAGLSAGFAMQFKITFLAALVAGSLWLLFRKRWRELAAFVAAGTLMFAVPYLLFWAREPRMPSQILALSPGIKDVRGCLKLISEAVKEPVVPLALAAFPLVVSVACPRWALLFLFASLSFLLSGIADVQVGGNINYFFEPLFALVPAAVLGVVILTQWARRRVGLAVFLSALVVIYLLPSNLPSNTQQLYRAVRSQGDFVKSRNDTFRIVQNVLQGRHIFTTVPRLAMMDPVPVLMEPLLLTYLQRLGKFDPQPIIERIRRNEFDLVITETPSRSWRGLVMSPDIHRAIEASYRPQCVVGNYLMHIPRSRSGDSGLLEELDRNRCVPIRVDNASVGPNW
jgi:glycosyl transferase family 87